MYIITRADDLGGAQAHVRDLATALQQRGEEVIVLAGGKGVFFEQLKVLNVACLPVKNLVHPIRPLKDISALMEIKKLLRDIAPDLVATHSNKAGLLGRLAAKMSGIPAVHTSHGFLFGGGEKQLSGRFYRLMEKIAAAAGEMVIAVSQSEYHLATQLKVIPPNKITVIHNGIAGLGEPGRAKPQREPARIIMVSRFAKPKDHQTLLEALAGLKDLPWSLQLVGDGHGRVQAEMQARQFGLEDKIEFTGTRSDVNDLLAAASIFVLSSRREGFPISILEAMRAGLPVVASRAGGVAEAVADGDTGYLFEPGDSAGLRSHLEELILNPALREELGRAGRQRYLEQFTLEKMAAETLKTYYTVTGQTAAP